MSKIVAYLKVAVAEAEHLLHEVHSPRELFLGLTEDVLSALMTKTLPTVSPPPVGAPQATPDTRDAQLSAQAAQIAALTAAVDAQIARLTSAAPPAAPAPGPSEPPPSA